MTRTLSRSIGAVLAAGALTVGAAGVAAATTATNAVNGTDVAVTFALEAGEVIDTCVAALTTPAKGAMLADSATNIDIAKVSELLNDKEITVLKTNGSILAVPSLLSPSVTVSATGVSANVYVLFSYCLSDDKPSVQPVTVGDPLQAGLGSVQSLSSDGASAAMSAVLTKALAGGMMFGS